MYLSHRVQKASKSDVREWGHIPGTMNIAFLSKMGVTR